jgi:hypothetical protein
MNNPEPAMAPHLIPRPHALRVSALALAAFSLASTSVPAPAQTVYREYDDGSFDVWPGDNHSYDAPLRRRPSADDDDNDDRFERDDRDDNDDDDNDDIEDRQGSLDLSPPRQTLRAAPQPPPSVNAKPDEKAWKPAL